MKKLISTLSLLLFLFLSSSATYAVSAETQSTDKANFILDDAYSYIEKNNIEIKLLDEKIKIYERQYNDSVDKSNYLKGKDFGGEERADKIKDKKDQSLTPKRNLLNLNSLKHDRDEKLKSLKVNVEKQFANISLLHDSIENIKTEQNNLDKQIEECQSKIKLGLLTSISLKPLDSQKVQLASQLTSTQRQMNDALLQLKKDLGIDLSKDIVTESLNMEFKKFDDSSIEERISDALENSYDFKKQTEDLELTKLEYDIVKDCSDLDSINQDLNQLEVDVKNKEVTLEDVKPSLEIKLWTSYNSLKNMEDEIEIQKLNLENAQITLNTTSAKVKAGMDTSLSELNARLAVEKQKIAVQKAINDYMLAAKDFDRLLESK